MKILLVAIRSRNSRLSATWSHMDLEFGSGFVTLGMDFPRWKTRSLCKFRQWSAWLRTRGHPTTTEPFCTCATLPFASVDGCVIQRLVSHFDASSATRVHFAHDESSYLRCNRFCRRGPFWSMSERP